MKTHVAIYKTHEEAMSAVKALSEKKFPMEHVSMVGKAEIIDDHIEVQSLENFKLLPLVLSILSGLGMGLFVSLGIVEIPGMEFMLTAGVLVNLFIGLNFGLIIGAFATIITAVLIKNDKVLKYKEHLVAKKFLVIVNGSIQEVELAEQILHTEGIHLTAA